jgi:predicted transcriptional regulator of viral defense system
VNQVEALRRLRDLGVRGLETGDAAALLDVTSANANAILRRLAQAGLVTHLSRGRWLVGREIPRFALPELLSAPYPAYVSLQSALFHHGLIEQIPAVVYAVTLARPRRATTPIGVVSFHRVPPALFSGFEIDVASDAKIATAEKALFDILYLAPARSRLFAVLPEIELPARFKWTELTRYAALVQSASRQTFLTESIARLRSRESGKRTGKSPRREPALRRG